ncbi:uncharacterized protein LOC128955463 [Oppia nitens]|uniref:uncharacterized protein LOC128955463 n=1 Tax=Oppia nitens TaxID=1686743 RepID=UPI0023DBEFEF|nr:uncharacterized protein LOC128955463 [Oppia nitens]
MTSFWRMRWLPKKRTLAIICGLLCLAFLSYQLLSLKALNVQMLQMLTKDNNVDHKVIVNHRTDDSVVVVDVVDVDNIDNDIIRQSLANNQNKSTIIVGVLAKYADHYYRQTSGQYFRCLVSGEQIQYKYLNDDYCDCIDGSDEPSTNACPHNLFYCTTKAANSEQQQYISSAKVNDGICDCCDGSDEYKSLSTPLKLTVSQIETIRTSRRIVPTPPCPNFCRTV